MADDPERFRRQVREATTIRRFPLGTWMAAGAALFCLAMSERFIVGPMRKEQEASGNAPGVSVFGDIAAFTGRVHTKEKTLADGSTLQEDGSIRRNP